MPARHRQCQLHRLLHMGHLQPVAKAAPHGQHIDLHGLRRDTRNSGGAVADEQRDLGAGPDFHLPLQHPHHRVHRLHRRMREVGNAIARVDDLARLQRGVHIALIALAVVIAVGIAQRLFKRGKYPVRGAGIVRRAPRDI